MDIETEKVPATLFPIMAMLLFWALTPISIAWIKNDFSLIFQVWVRYLCSASMLGILLLTKESFATDLKSFQQHKFYFLSRIAVTAACTIMFQLMYTWCFFLIPPGFGTLLYQSQVIFSVFLGMLFFKTERNLIRRPGTFAGLLLAIFGACLVIIFQSHGFTVALNLGILLAIGGAVSWACVGVTVKIWIEGRLTPLFTVTLVFTLITLLLAPVVLLSGPHLAGTPGLDKWLVLIGSGLLGIAGGQALY